MKMMGGISRTSVRMSAGGRCGVPRLGGIAVVFLIVFRSASCQQHDGSFQCPPLTTNCAQLPGRLYCPLLIMRLCTSSGQIERLDGAAYPCRCPLGQMWSDVSLSGCLPLYRCLQRRRNSVFPTNGNPGGPSGSANDASDHFDKESYPAL